MAQGASRKVFEEGPTSFCGVSRRDPMTVLEAAEVLNWKARTRSSWQAAAGYAGRCQHDVRMACDPEYAHRNGKPAQAFAAAVARRERAEADDA